jgi:ABC-type uncharacterized transport system permease subunit
VISPPSTRTYVLDISRINGLLIVGSLIAYRYIGLSLWLSLGLALGVSLGVSLGALLEVLLKVLLRVLLGV